MRGALLWAVSVLVLWAIPWPSWLPGSVDPGGEVKLGLSVVAAVIVAFGFTFFINLVLAPIKIDAESQNAILTLSQKLTPKLTLRASRSGKTQKIDYGAVATSFSGSKHIQMGLPKGNIVAIDVINPTSTLIATCEASIVYANLAYPERDTERYIQSQKSRVSKEPRIVDPIPLLWVKTNGNQRTVNIPSGVTRRLQVVSELNGNLHFMTSDTPASYIFVFQKGFEYELRVAINSENSAAVFVSVILDWRDALKFTISEIDRDVGIQGLLEPAT